MRKIKPSDRRNQAFIKEIGNLKMSKGCTDCGYKGHPEALEFDHLPGYKKLDKISNLARKGLRKKTFDEIKKCEIVCSNCHAIRTAKRRKAAKRKTKERKNLRKGGAFLKQGSLFFPHFNVNINFS